MFNPFAMRSLSICLLAFLWNTVFADAGKLVPWLEADRATPFLQHLKATLQASGANYDRSTVETLGEPFLAQTYRIRIIDDTGKCILKFDWCVRGSQDLTNISSENSELATELVKHLFASLDAATGSSDDRAMEIKIISWALERRELAKLSVPLGGARVNVLLHPVVESAPRDTGNLILVPLEASDLVRMGEPQKETLRLYRLRFNTGTDKVDVIEERALGLVKVGEQLLVAERLTSSAPFVLHRRPRPAIQMMKFGRDGSGALTTFDSAFLNEILRLAYPAATHADFIGYLDPDRTYFSAPLPVNCAKAMLSLRRAVKRISAKNQTGVGFRPTRFSP